MIQILPVEGLPEIQADDDLAALIAGRAELEDGDVVCVAHKVVSKAEGRVVRARRDRAVPEGGRARRLGGRSPPARGRPPRSDAHPPLAAAARDRGDPARLRLRIRRRRRVERAGAGDRRAAPRGSRRLRRAAPRRSSSARTGRTLGVVVTDTFGRAWRRGIANVAIGSSGIEVLRDLRGRHDPAGYELHATVIALADEIAAAAELAMGKTERVPVAVVRGAGRRRRGLGARARHAARARSLSLIPRSGLSMRARVCR